MNEIKGHLVLLMAPSGSGKKTIIDGLGELKEKIYFAKTYTSREPRVGAPENPQYVFISRTEFEGMIETGDFVEWAEFSGNLYGTPKSEFTEPLKESQLVFKEMELQGVEQIKKIIPGEHLTTIYIDAGSWEDLRARIVARAPITEEALKLREERFNIESKFKDQADIVIENKNGMLESARSKMKEVISDIINKVAQ